MEVVTGAMGNLLYKLGELLTEEYNLHKGVKKNVESLCREMKGMHAALVKVAEVPRDQLDPQIKLWADEVRELSYNIEDIVDRFLVRVSSCEPATTDNQNKLRQLMQKMGNLFRKAKARHQIATAIKDINKEVQEVASRRDRYALENSMPTRRTTIDPRLRALYTEARELVGIYGKRDQELIKLLSLGDDDPDSKKKLKIVSVVGFGGLGKTTLVRAVYDNIKAGFDCVAFVPVGRNPDVKKVFRDILIGLDKQKYSTNYNFTVLDEMQLIEEIQEFLKNKRYLVIIDDVWDEKLWKCIKLAFSNMNNLGSRLITTTRIVSVSKACCPSTSDSVYQMKPLSIDDSTGLFHKRIFSNENGCPSELEEVSRDMLKKCGGVPLAIITIASLLACDQQIKPKDEWHALLNSIGRGLAEDASLEEMQRILSFSYYDLPSHLKTCLLYLCMYPEDREIGRDELIWKWICEDFVQCGKQDTNIFEVGESYFNELVNRSMIQPAYYGHLDDVTGCRVHDMVLDLICLLSSEENFVTIFDGTKDITSFCGNIRRLSLQDIKNNKETTPLSNSVSLSQVRSFIIFSPAINIMPAISSFDVLRVLDLRGCYPVNLKDIGYLLHLRYLGLKHTSMLELPAEIGSLQSLQVLDVHTNSGLKVLPSTVRNLRKLVVVYVLNHCEWLPDVLGNLIFLEELESISASMSMVQELGNLVRLRKLRIYFYDWSSELEEAFVESLCNMHNIQSLTITCSRDFGSTDLLGERWVPPRHLCRFTSENVIFSTMPSWIKRCSPSHLANLSELVLKVKEVNQDDLQMLGRLPALRSLVIQSTCQIERLLVISADGFRCLSFFTLFCKAATQVVFQRGALPRVETVAFNLGAQVSKQDGNGDHFELGLGNLRSVQSVNVWIYWEGVTVEEAKQVEAAVRNALNTHPNHPHINITYDGATYSTRYTTENAGPSNTTDALEMETRPTLRRSGRAQTFPQLTLQENPSS